MYRLATVHNVTDKLMDRQTDGRQTEDSMMQIVDHTACRTIG